MKLWVRRAAKSLGQGIVESSHAGRVQSCGSHEQRTLNEDERMQIDSLPYEHTSAHCAAKPLANYAPSRVPTTERFVSLHWPLVGGIRLIAMN